MKKIILIIFLIIPFLSFSQDKPTDNSFKSNHELKVNAAMSILGLPEVSYERFIKNNASVGVSVLVKVDQRYDLNYMIFPYYRFFFGEKRASGFFLETNLAFYSEEGYLNGMLFEEGDTYLSFGGGIAAGGKFFSKNNFVGEFFLGLGRNFIHREDIVGLSDIYPRVGISIGKRF